jgi:hypothetical protein
MELKCPHPDAPSIDHLYPRVVWRQIIGRNTKVHDERNLILAHLRCNMVKRDRVVMPTLRHWNDASDALNAAARAVGMSEDTREWSVTILYPPTRQAKSHLNPSPGMTRAPNRSPCQLDSEKALAVQHA